MIKFYIWSIIFFIISAVLFVFRYIVLKDKITLNNSNRSQLENLYLLLRILIAGMLPLINVFLGFIYLYYAIFVSDDDFIDFCNDEM